MNIRIVKDSDLIPWAAMREQLWPGAEDGYVDELKAFFADIPSPICQAFVLENEAQLLCGFIELSIRSNVTASDSPQIPYIEGWFIAKDYRAQGYGIQLMHRAQQWALESGYSEIGSDANLDNQRSIKAHLGFGFKETERTVSFIKKLQKFSE